MKIQNIFSKKILFITTLLISSVTVAADSTSNSYNLTKELCAEYYTDCADVYGTASSGGMSACGNSLNTCITTGDWIPPNISLSSKFLNIFSSVTKDTHTSQITTI
ncbi:hypothetical protein [Acinetobacter sp. 161(2023)]|uniref:hypothetical protein n=1 Tax=Acinetobacter sp. 161(2023) TaxID=3098768 RepID=UPI00300A163F